MSPTKISELRDVYSKNLGLGIIKLLCATEWNRIRRHLIQCCWVVITILKQKEITKIRDLQSCRTSTTVILLTEMWRKERLKHALVFFLIFNIMTWRVWNGKRNIFFFERMWTQMCIAFEVERFGHPQLKDYCYNLFLFHKSFYRITV